MTCHRCNLACCICGVVTDKPTFVDIAIVALCVAVYLGAFALAIWPPGVP